MAILAALLGPRRIAERRHVPARAASRPTTLIYEEIRARRDAPDLDERDDVLSMLLQARHEDGSPMRDQELRDELMTLLVAGHETTATALAWAFERAARTPPRSRGCATRSTPARTPTWTRSSRRRCGSGR